MECPICSELFNDVDHCPRLLRCGHTCCEQCLNHVLKESLITCPTCRDIMVTSSPGNLPKNYTVLEFISLHKPTDQSSRTNISGRCETHPDENVIRYCIDCSVAVCAECIIESHSGHKLVKLDDPVLELRFEVKGLVTKVEEMLYAANFKKEEMIKKQQNINLAATRELERIESFFEKIYEKLEQRKSELKNKVEEETKECERKVVNDVEEIERFVTQMNDYVNNLQTLSSTIEQTSTKELASQSWQQKITQGKREVHVLLSTSQRISLMDSSTVLATKTLFNPKPLIEEIGKYGLVTVGDDIHNPAIYCFGTQNILFKFNLNTQRWSQVLLIETNGYEFKNFSSIVALPSGSILITGGTKSNEVFEFKDFRMYKRCNMLHVRSSHNAVYYMGAVYCIGGYNGSSWHDKCEKVSIDNFNSVPIANLNYRRCAFSSTVTNNYIYVFGGYDGSKYLDNIERYNVIYDKWEVLPCVLHRPLQNTGAACYAENKIIIAGGYNEKGTLSVVRALELDTFEWINMPNMTHTRYLMNKFHYCGGNIYAIGGSAQGQNIEYFNVAEGRWISLRSYKELTEDTMYKWAAVITHDMSTS